MLQNSFDRIVLSHEGLELGISRWGENSTILLRRINSKAFGVRYRDDSDAPERFEVGHVEAWLYLGDLAEALGADIVDLADSEDQQSYEAAELLFGKKSKLLTDERNRNAIYLHHIYVRPEFRGMGLARELLTNALTYHDPTRVAGVLLCVNSQYDMPDGDPLKGKDKKAGDAKLGAYYGGLGFRKVSKGKGYMYGRMDALAATLGLWNILDRD